MNFFYYTSLFIFALAIFILAAACADVSPESNGFATLKIRMDDISHRQTGRADLSNTTMTTNDAKTILAVLMPAVQCEATTANSGVEYDRALTDLTSKQVQLTVPLETQLKLCLYFFRDTLSLNDLTTGSTVPDGFGESGIFTVDSETAAKTVSVEFWTTSYSTVTFKISSTSSTGMIVGTSGTVKLNSMSGKVVDNKTFTVTDNASKSVEFSNVVYNSYSYDVNLQGFIPVNEAFLVSGSTETKDVKLTPNMVELDWLSFENLSISQVGTTAYATASGTVVLNVPNAKKDNVTQMISIMQVKRVSGDSLDVTPPTALSSWTKTEGSDNVTYRSPFSITNSLSLVNGSNELQVVLTVDGKSKTETMGTITYDACVDSDTMCLKLTWTDGLDPDLHSYYFPDWTYQEETGTFDNTSRGTRYWIYSNTANKAYSGSDIQLKDGNISADEEVQVWATDSGKVGNGTYLFYVQDVSETDVQDFKLVLSGPGLSDNKTYGTYDFKNDDNASTTEAANPQAVFFIQVQNNSIARSDNISVGDNLSSTLMQWTGTLQTSVVE